jgi:hypothetical protein
MSPPGRERRVVLAAVAAALLVVLGAGPATALAAADDPSPTLDDVRRLPSSALLAREPVPGGMVTLGAPMPSNPNGCAGATDVPTQVNGKVSVRGRTTCTYSAQQLGVGTTLYRSDWWGLNPMDTGTSSRPTGTSSGDAVASASCARATTRTYVGVSSHRVTVSGVVYSSTTSSSATFACRS